MNVLIPRSITEILSSAIAPVTLITGVAFLTSIMTPRFGRCIDRIRTLLSQIKAVPTDGHEYEYTLKQLEILYARTRILRNTLTISGLCIFFVVLAIGATFSSLIFGIPGPVTTLILFLLALASLVVLTMGFIYDFLASLKAVKLEIDCALGAPLSELVRQADRKVSRQVKRDRAVVTLQV
jgi:hypothetical protein